MCVVIVMLVVILQRAFISVHIFFFLHSQSPLCFSVSYLKKNSLWFLYKHPSDGLDIMNPGVLAYRPNIQMSFCSLMSLRLAI